MVSLQAFQISVWCVERITFPLSALAFKRKASGLTEKSGIFSPLNLTSIFNFSTIEYFSSIVTFLFCTRLPYTFMLSTSKFFRASKTLILAMYVFIVFPSSEVTVYETVLPAEKSHSVPALGEIVASLLTTMDGVTLFSVTL